MFLAITFLCMSCDQDQILAPAVSKKLQSFMEMYDFPVYGLFFIEHDSTKYVIIEGNHTYDKYLTDGYFFFKDHLVTYSFLDNRQQDGLINVEKTISYKDTIPGYKSDDPYDDNRTIYETSAQRDYVITPDQQLTRPSVTNPAFRGKRHVDGDNVIKDKHINALLNNTINGSNKSVFILRLKEINDDYYFSITPSIFYDSRHVLGFFFRDKYPVFIYTDKCHGDLSSLIEMDSLKRGKGGIEHVRDYFNGLVFVSKKVYRLSGDTIEDVSSDRFIRMSVDVME